MAVRKGRGRERMEMEMDWREETDRIQTMAGMVQTVFLEAFPFSLSSFLFVRVQAGVVE